MTTTQTRELLVIHEPGQVEGGRPWLAVLAEAWPGRVVAPDLPGHGTAAPPVDGAYTLSGFLCPVVADLPPAGDAPRPIVVAIGGSGWVAMVLALAGEAAGLALVDGLGGPWRRPAQAIEAGVAQLRALADDPAALAPPPGGGQPDPRWAYGLARGADRAMTQKALAGINIPLLVCSTPDDPLEAAERQRLLAGVPGPVESSTARSRRAEDVAALVADWAGRLDQPNR